MKNTILLAFALAGFGATAFPADQRIAFERNDAVYIANLDGTGEKKIAEGIFPAISPDGTRVPFNFVEKTSDTTYVRHIAVVEVATGKLNVFRDVPSDNSYYPTWTADGTQILFSTRKSLPPETMSKPAPASASSFRIARLEFALTA
jgi:TolB protein